MDDRTGAGGGIVIGINVSQSYKEKEVVESRNRQHHEETRRIKEVSFEFSFASKTLCPKIFFAI